MDAAFHSHLFNGLHGIHNNPKKRKRKMCNNEIFQSQRKNEVPLSLDMNDDLILVLSQIDFTENGQLVFWLFYPIFLQDLQELTQINLIKEKKC